jgi:hypothetical protein
MKLLVRDCKHPHCPAVYLTEDGDLAVIGDELDVGANEVVLGPGERLVKVPRTLIVQAVARLEAASR